MIPQDLAVTIATVAAAVAAILSAWVAVMAYRVQQVAFRQSIKPNVTLTKVIAEQGMAESYVRVMSVHNHGPGAAFDPVFRFASYQEGRLVLDDSCPNPHPAIPIGATDYPQNMESPWMAVDWHTHTNEQARCAVLIECRDARGGAYRFPFEFTVVMNQWQIQGPIQSGSLDPWPV